MIPCGRDSEGVRRFLLSMFRYIIREIDPMFPCVYSAIYHTRRQNVVRTSLIHFLFL